MDTTMEQMQPSSSKVCYMTEHMTEGAIVYIHALWCASQEPYETRVKRIYCELGRECLSFRARLHAWEQNPQGRKPYPCGRQFRLLTAVQNYADCFLSCGHFCCMSIPDGVPWAHGEAMQSCAAKHAESCIATAGSRLEHFTDLLKRDRGWRPVRRHHKQERDQETKVRLSLFLFATDTH